MTERIDLTRQTPPSPRPPPFVPLATYRKGDRVRDNRKSKTHTEPGGIFEALADLRAGFLDPRYVAIDRPNTYWRRVT